MKIATWNARTTFEEGALANLSEVMKEYDVDILALQETKQIGSEITKIGEYTFFKSGGVNKYLGVGFIVIDKIQRSVVEFNADQSEYAT